MNINTKKYYDYESIGGGVPYDKLKSDEYATGMMGLGEYKEKEWNYADSYTWNLISKSFRAGYSLATERLKEQEQEIERLKAENERLRGVVNTASSKLDEYIFDVHEIRLRHEKMLSNDVSMMLDTLESILIPPPPKSK